MIRIAVTTMEATHTKMLVGPPTTILDLGMVSTRVAQVVHKPPVVHPTKLLTTTIEAPPTRITRSRRNDSITRSDLPMHVLNGSLI